MIKRWVYLVAAGGLALGLLGLGLWVSAVRDDFLNRYPGSVRVAPDQVAFHPLSQAVLRLQATYQTPAEWAAVRRWYAARLGVSPASELYVTSSDGCAWLTASRLLIRWQHTVAVLVCPAPGGTRVVVNEQLEREP